MSRPDIPDIPDIKWREVMGVRGSHIPQHTTVGEFASLLEESAQTLRAMDRGDRHSISMDDAATVLNIYSHLDPLYYTLPLIEAWSVFSIYDPAGDFSPGKEVVWAAFFSKKQAKEFHPFFDKALGVGARPGGGRIFQPVALREVELGLLFNPQLKAQNIPWFWSQWRR